ncbi:MAG: IscS subfamily cysteine desulfurase [Bacillales bacterium]|nr:IscS subfamily cysteine desulfurase [Bacillales bacterium]
MKYFDCAATVPMDEEAISAYVEMNKMYFGNSESHHNIGIGARDVLENCRSILAERMGIEPRGLFFTSGGTESNLLAILSLARKARETGKGNHIITAESEHNSVHSAFSFLEKEGFHVTKLKMEKDGRISPKRVLENLRSDTILISIQHVNQEIGTIQPIQEISRLIDRNKVLFHTDCVQSFGKVDVRTIIPYVDSITVSSHKIGGPKGVGAVYIHPDCSYEPVFPLLSQEHGFRGGTVNVPGIAAFAVAAAKTDPPSYWKECLRKRELFRSALPSFPYTIYEAEQSAQLPSIIGMAMDGIEGQLVMLECNRLGFAISTGSACSESKGEGAKTMAAIGEPDASAKQFFRISFSHQTADIDIIELAKALFGIARKFSPGSLAQRTMVQS